MMPLWQDGKLVKGMEYACERCSSTYNGKKNKYLKVRPGEHIGILPLAFRKIKPLEENANDVHPLICSDIVSFNEFTILVHHPHKYFR